MPGHAQQQRVHGLRVAKQALCQCGTADKQRPGRVRPPFDRAAMQHSIHPHIPVRQKWRTCLQVQIAEHGRARRTAAQHICRRGHGQVRAQHHVRRSERDAHDIKRHVRHLHMRHDGAVLLRQPGKVERADLVPLQMRSHGDDSAAGHDSAPADAGKQAAPR